MQVQKLISSTLSTTLSIAALAVMGLGAAHADIIPVFMNSAASGGVSTFTYRIDVTNDQQAAPQAGAAFSAATDSFATIYDFAGFVPGSLTVTSGPLATSVQNVGVTPPFVLAPDDPTVPNLTIYYKGATIMSGPLTLGFITAQTTLTDFNPSGFFAAQAQKNVGLSRGTTIDNIGRTTVPAGPPAVPEPATLAPFGLGGLGLLGLIARKTRRAGGVSGAAA